MKFEKVTIAGVGLIGGAMGIELREKNLAEKVTGWGRNIKHLKEAVAAGACDEITTDYSEAVTGADLVVLATPPQIIVKQLSLIKPFLREGAIVTDVGSTKKSIVRAAQEAALDEKKAVFIGSHPMAGSDKTGVENVYSGLFNGETCIVTPYKNSGETVDIITQLWEKLGAKVVSLSPDEHDMAVGAVSHLPHILATVLVETVANETGTPKRASLLSGDSLKEMTRVAMASPELWYEIYSGNRENLIKLIDNTQASLKKFKETLQKDEREKLIDIMDKSKRFREDI